MDKRRYVARKTGAGRDKRHDMASDAAGDAAADGFSVRHHKPLQRDPFERERSLHGEHYACGGLMDETDAAMQRFFGDNHD